MRSKKSSTKQTEAVDSVVSPPINYKTIQNVSLQAWPIPTPEGSIKLTPGGTVSVPISLISQRVINLHKRRLISIR